MEEQEAEDPDLIEEEEEDGTLPFPTQMFRGGEIES